MTTRLCLNSRSAFIASIFAVFAAISAGPTVRGETPREWATANVDKLFQLYQFFHTHPELSFQEKETAARLAKELKAAGVAVTEGVGGTGGVGVLKNGKGPLVMLRTDLDALPVTELTGLAYASKVKVKDPSGVEVGVMHACGHDIHITNLVAMARYFSTHKDQWAGTLMFLGQPAEERGSGAKKMLDDKLFERFGKPDFALALHCDSTLASDQVGCRGGFMLANVDSVDITIRGRGGHGAMPHTTVDPIVTAAQLILSLQTIVSREMKPTDPAVVTVGSIHGGTKHNIIGDTCTLQITVRSYSDSVRAHLLKSIQTKADAISAAAGAQKPLIAISEGTPAMFNDEKLAARMSKVFQDQFGLEKVIPGEPSMGGEDFSQYGRAGVPILMFRVGTVEPARLERLKKLEAVPSLHSPLFYPDAEPTLITAAQSMIAATLELMKK
ncbi:MAG: amidohydrolase [Pirellulaceae bacterium]|nr:amidohydrolase [Pirellulaceae bacterium]